MTMPKLLVCEKCDQADWQLIMSIALCSFPPSYKRTYRCLNCGAQVTVRSQPADNSSSALRVILYEEDQIIQ